MPKWILRAVQVAIAAAVILFVWRAIEEHWSQLGNTGLPPLDFHFGWIAVSAATVLVTYLLLIEAWRFILIGWEQHLSTRAAIRIWCLSNLGRYVPGKVWAVAGMAMLAKSEGVDGWSATASALVMQVIALATAAVAVLAAAPALSAGGANMSVPALVAAGSVGLLTIWLLTVPAVMNALGRLTRGRFHPKPLGLKAVAAGTVSTLLSWLAYGLALWLLARGVVPDATLSLSAAIGGFAAAYVIGLISVFAPGGIGVREGVLFALLAPTIGPGNAVVLVPASRMLLTLTEVLAAGGGALLQSRGSRLPPTE